VTDERSESVRAGRRADQPTDEHRRCERKLAGRQGFELGERPSYKWLMALDFWF
jgi:hypothetical protein